MNIVLIGPPGSGKGTQAHLLVDDFHWAYFSSGDILRYLAGQKTSLGQQIKSIIDRGQLVSNRLMTRVVADFLSKNKGRGILFDGFPRNLAQAKELINHFHFGQGKDQVFYLQVNKKEIIKRLSSRVVCSRCGAVYNLLTNPPQKKGICDRCGGKLITRADEKPAVVSRRLDVYQELTAPVIDYFRQKKILTVVDGEQPIDKIHQQLKRMVEKQLN